ncbi:hypothetical protein [Photobacterium leiognathi]|uniref:hypothetical protein n=1 Tax=Photobacterium leiognathi TaxID=553611 RepID=UPI002981D846|nr:hypothetical protein [Photobacterium leiognathi]
MTSNNKEVVFNMIDGYRGTISQDNGNIIIDLPAYLIQLATDCTDVKLNKFDKYSSLTLSNDCSKVVYHFDKSSTDLIHQYFTDHRHLFKSLTL